MVWLRWPAAGLIAAKDKTNHTNTGTLPYRGNSLAADLGVNAMNSLKHMSCSSIGCRFIGLCKGST